jgi:hypothetical protein
MKLHPRIDRFLKATKILFLTLYNEMEDTDERIKCRKGRKINRKIRKEEAK